MYRVESDIMWTLVSGYKKIVIYCAIEKNYSEESRFANLLSLFCRGIVKGFRLSIGKYLIKKIN
jgi:hypothetical protein